MPFLISSGEINSVSRNESRLCMCTRAFQYTRGLHVCWRYKCSRRKKRRFRFTARTPWYFLNTQATRDVLWRWKIIEARPSSSRRRGPEEPDCKCDVGTLRCASSGKSTLYSMLLHSSVFNLLLSSRSFSPHALDFHICRNMHDVWRKKKEELSTHKYANKIKNIEVMLIRNQRLKKIHI